MALDLVQACWRARTADPELLDRCYAPEGRFRAVRVDAKGETVVARAPWIAEARAVRPWLGPPPAHAVMDRDPDWPNLKVEPGKVAGEIRVSFFHARLRGPRMEGVWRELTLGSGAPGPSPAIVEEREEARPPLTMDRVERRPLRGEPACPASVDLRAGTYVVVTAAHEKFSAALAAIRQARRAKRPAEIIPGRWLSPPEETFVVATAAFADRARAERRAAELGGRVLEVAALGPGGPVPAWGLEATGRIDGLAEMIDLRGDRVVSWGSAESTGWRLGDGGLTVETGVSWPFHYPPSHVIDPFTEQKRPNPIGPLLPGLGAPLPGAGAQVRVDERGDQLEATAAAAAGSRTLWTLPLAARDRILQVFPRKGGLTLHFGGGLFLLRQTAASGVHLGKLCGKITIDSRAARAGTVTIPTAGATPLQLDGDGSFELWTPVPSVAALVPDLATMRCRRDLTPSSRGTSSALVTELGARADVQVTCE